MIVAPYQQKGIAVDLSMLKDAPDTTDVKTEPVPGAKRRGRPPGSKNRNTASATQAKFAKDFAEDANAAIKLAALMWSSTDPMCAGVLNTQSEAIAESLADLISQSERMRRIIGNGLGFGKILPLLMAMSPVIATIKLHHLTPPQQEESEDFQRQPNNGTGWVNNIAGMNPGMVPGVG